MPRKPKSGPPYTDIPDEVYVVVTNPWCMKQEPRSRDRHDYNCIATWAQYALQQAGLAGDVSPTVECIYGVGTRSEIIMQFAEGTDIIPLLGEHRWVQFRVPCPDPNASTCVFVYNWKTNGDPANHGWTENFPESISFEEMEMSVKSPYPAPSWTSPPSTLVNLVLPIPRPAFLPANPGDDNSPDPEQQSFTSPLSPPRPKDKQKWPEEQELASIGVFRPYAPPSQHPSHAQFLSKPKEACKMSPPSPIFVKKLDPYELDEDAFNIIRSTTPVEDTKKEEDIKPILGYAIKAEIPEVKTEESETQRNSTCRSDSGYRPSQALIDAFDSLRQPKQVPVSVRPSTRDLQGSNTASRVVPPASLGYQPSAELEAHIQTFLRGTNSAAASPQPGNNTRLTPGARVAIKREYDDSVATFPGQRKKIKVEED